MFDTNKFKRSVKDWMRDNPNAPIHELVDYCEEQIPPTYYAMNKWLVDQTVSWYQHILTTREISSTSSEDGD